MGQAEVPLVYTDAQLRRWSSLSEIRCGHGPLPGQLLQRDVMDFRSPWAPTSTREAPTNRSCCIWCVCRETGHTRPSTTAGCRMELYTTPFETFERNVREQLGRMLGPGGFDANRDIEAITVNRWPHGYADFFRDIDDPDCPPTSAPTSLAAGRSDASASQTLTRPLRLRLKPPLMKRIAPCRRLRESVTAQLFSFAEHSGSRDMHIRESWLVSLLLLGVIAVAPPASRAAPTSGNPEKIIIDTDIGTDIDDAFAVALALQSTELKILATRPPRRHCRSRQDPGSDPRGHKSQRRSGCSRYSDDAAPFHTACWAPGQVR